MYAFQKKDSKINIIKILRILYHAENAALTLSIFCGHVILLDFV